MTTPQDQVPLPPKGYPSWLDCLIDGPLMRARYDLARAELAALRKELADTKANWLNLQSVHADAEKECHHLRKELSDTHGLLATARENLVAFDAQRAEAVRERDAVIAEDTDLLNAAHKAMREANQELDALRAQVAEMREAILGVGELPGPDAWFSDCGDYLIRMRSSSYHTLSALMAKLRAEPAPKEEKQP